MDKSKYAEKCIAKSNVAFSVDPQRLVEDPSLFHRLAIQHLDYWNEMARRLQALENLNQKYRDDPDRGGQLRLIKYHK